MHRSENSEPRTVTSYADEASMLKGLRSESHNCTFAIDIYNRLFPSQGQQQGRAEITNRSSEFSLEPILQTENAVW